MGSYVKPGKRKMTTYDFAFKKHVTGKPHKRRLHALKTDPYTVEESERAAGMGSYVKPGKRKMTTLIPEAVKKGESLADVKKRAKTDKDVDEMEAVEDGDDSEKENSASAEDDEGDQ